MMHAALAVLFSFQNPSDTTGLDCWPSADRAAQRAYEESLNDVPDPTQLRAWHDLLCSEPHIAGTPGDTRTIESLVATFEGMGLDVERHDIWVYLSRPVSASLEIVTPERETLVIKEAPLEQDADTSHPDLEIGFNAYAATGDVTGEVVYVNYGRKEDYQQLARRGVEMRGKIMLARYGRNYRGYKVKFAETFGAAGVLIYTDPKDSGFTRGTMYPDGGWANEWSIQRGSIVTKPYPGDPLTPFRESRERTRRLDPAVVDLPKIPVQPIGWGAAERIMRHMNGRTIPADLAKRWTGGLPVTYHLDGGPKLTVRLQVAQEREIVKTANVVATLDGALAPEDFVVLGCHHDAWGFGAGDPDSGMICLIESARSFAALADAGQRPARSIKFAAWGAEEHGIVGSTEWCEAHRGDLSAHCLGYVNMDMAAMGTTVRSSAAPLLRQVIIDATRAVGQLGGSAGETVYDRWTEGDTKTPRLGDLGGGSDHIGFYSHLGIPSCSIGAGGAAGTSYHSNYDTLRWYRQTVGDDYEPARMVTQLTNVLAARLANAAIVPYDVVGLGAQVRRHIDALEARAAELGFTANLDPIRNMSNALDDMVEPVWAELLEQVAAGSLDPDRLDAVNRQLLQIERAWLSDDGLPGRPWFRSIYVATDPDSGYASWILPNVRRAIERRNDEELRAAIEQVLRSLAAAGQAVRQAHASTR